jgi:hypothetical protein
MIPFAVNVRMPMVPNLSGGAAGLKEKRLFASSPLALVHAASQIGDKNKALDDTLLLDHSAEWHNNHGNDPGDSTLNFAQEAAFNMEWLRPCQSTLALSHHVHAVLEGYHAPCTDHTLDVIAGETVHAGAPAYIVSNNTANLASATGPTKSRAVGLVTQAASANDATVVQTDGCVTLSDWTSVIGTASLTPGSVYFLHTTDGQMSTTPPTSDGDVVVTMGVAVTTTKFDIEVNEVAVL